MVIKLFSYHALTTTPEKLLELLNEQGALGFRTVTVQLDRPGSGALVIFEQVTDLT